MAKSIDGEVCFGACAKEFSPCRLRGNSSRRKIHRHVGARRFACPLCGSAAFSAVE
jgi:hypothetical protein